MAEKVKATISHNQEIDGKRYKPGDSVTLDPELARVIAARGGIQVREDTPKAPAKPEPAKKEVAK
ncbi:DUF7210 family protein [Brachybacterium subflavum]|uniref:DUF7210 family protein n=1 Tax=Brachybacterium subflavum TaxID=2585206 RepID=UPI00126638D5|nr:hypothetical protein [Brachybacterium subflavum]